MRILYYVVMLVSNNGTFNCEREVKGKDNDVGNAFDERNRIYLYILLLAKFLQSYLTFLV